MIYQKIINYCKENKMSVCDFEKKCGIGNGTIGRWKDDVSKPTLSTLQKIENATKIPISEWVGSEV